MKNAGKDDEMLLTANEETYQDGQIIFEEGSYGDWIYVIESGQVELSKSVDTRKIVLEVLGKGDIFGELGFITKQPRTATARAVGTSVIGVVDKDFLIAEHNKLSGNFRMILNTIVTRLNRVTEISAQSKLKRTEKRVHKVLSLSYNSKEELVSAFSENASQHGMFIKTKRPLAVGEQFVLRLSLPNAKAPISIGCQVSWGRKTAESPNRPAGMGVTFVKISKDDQALLGRELAGE